MNLFQIPPELPKEEWTEILACGEGIRIERIVSTGQISPPGFWYDQPEDEWLVLLAGEGRVAYPNGQETVLLPGDSLFLKAHQRHRVSYTSQNPPAVWLCVFGDMEPEE